MIFLKDTDVSLRPITESDCDLLATWINDPDVRMFLNSYTPITPEEEKGWVKHLHQNKHVNLVLMIEVDDKPIGNMGLHKIHHKDGTATTGALIGDKTFWGKGYGSKAKRLLLEHAFLTLNLRKVISSVKAFNERSIAYNLRCGYEEEGRLREQVFHKGAYYDEILFGVFRDKWIEANREWLSKR